MLNYMTNYKQKFLLISDGIIEKTNRLLQYIQSKTNCK